MTSANDCPALTSTKLERWQGVYWNHLSVCLSGWYLLNCSTELGMVLHDYEPGSPARKTGLLIFMVTVTVRAHVIHDCFCCIFRTADPFGRKHLTVHQLEPDCLAKQRDCCVQGQGHSNGDNFGRRLSGGYLLNGWTFCKQLVSWCFEPSQPQRIISGLKTNFSLSPSYSLNKL